MTYLKGYLNSRIKYHGRKGSSISGKFSFIGLGLMGSRVVDVIAQLKDQEGKPFYPTLAINSNLQDLESIENCQNKLVLRGYERGAGRDPVIGQEALQANEGEVKERFKEMAQGQDMVFMIAGLGGGTGTGGILNLTQWASQMREYYGINFGLILSLPRLRDKRVENQNALAILAKLNRLVAAREIPMIIIDNEYLYSSYKEKREKGEIAPGTDWTADSNLVIAGLIHQLNLITGFKPNGNKHFDGQELLRVLNTGGCITFSRTDLTIDEFKDRTTLVANIKTGIDKGIVAGGYNYRQEARSAGFSIVAPSRKASQVLDILSLEVLEDNINQLLPEADIFWGTYIDQNEAERVHVYSIISGMGLPKRVMDISDFVKEQENKENEVKALDLAMPSIVRPNNKVSIEFDTPFGGVEKETSAGLELGFNTETLRMKKNGLKELGKVPDWLK